MKKAERDHISKVVESCCIACRLNGIDDSQAEAHHIGNGTMGKKASNFEVIALCPIHHRSGGHGVAVHAGRKAFEAVFGTEQELLEMTINMLCENN